MARKISQTGLQKIKQWEGCILYAYDDFDTRRPPRRIQKGDRVSGTLTIGYGHTGPDVQPGMSISQERADALLEKDLRRFEAAVESKVKVSLNDNQFAALVSFALNVGTGNFGSSTLLKKLNKGQYDAVPAELMKWVHSKGKRMAGLVNRRSQESALWGSGSFVSSNTVPAAPKADAKGVATDIAAGGAGIGAAIAPELPKIVDSVQSQQDELNSGQWVRIAIAVVIIALTAYSIYRKVSK